MDRAWLTVPLETQFKSRFRSGRALASAALPALVSGLLIGYALPEVAAPLLFSVTMAALWAGGSVNIREIVDERPLVARDRDLDLFGYALSKLAYSAAIAALHAVVLSFSVLAMNAAAVPVPAFLAAIFLVAWSGGLLGLLLSALCDDPATSLKYFPLLLIPQVLFGGLIVPVGDIEPFAWDERGAVIAPPPQFARKATRSRGVRWLSGICVARWTSEGMAAAILSHEPEGLRATLQSARVANSVPVTLASPAPSLVLRRPLSQPAPASVGLVVVLEYFAILTLFGAAKAGLFVAVLHWRDPRRYEPRA